MEPSQTVVSPTVKRQLRSPGERGWWGCRGFLPPSFTCPPPRPSDPTHIPTAQQPDCCGHQIVAVPPATLHCSSPASCPRLPSPVFTDSNGDNKQNQPGSPSVAQFPRWGIYT